MKTALDLHHALLDRGVRHEVVRLPGHASSADELPTLLSVGNDECVAVRCYRVTDARTPDGSAVHLVAVAVRAGDTPDETAVTAALGAASIRPATADEVSAHTGYAASLVSPLDLPEDVVLLADSALADDRSAVRYCATGESGTALAVRLRDLLVESGAHVASLTPRPVVGVSAWSGGEAVTVGSPRTDRRDSRRSPSALAPRATGHLSRRSQGGTRTAG